MPVALAITVRCHQPRVRVSEVARIPNRSTKPVMMVGTAAMRPTAIASTEAVAMADSWNPPRRAMCTATPAV
jgi:hypothetical protein